MCGLPRSTRPTNSLPFPDDSGDVSHAEGQIVAEVAKQTAQAILDWLGASIDAQPLLDINGAAKRLNVSPRTVESHVAQGDIPVIRIGTKRGVRRFDPAALDAFIRRNTRTLG